MVAQKFGKKSKSWVWVLINVALKPSGILVWIRHLRPHGHIVVPFLESRGVILEPRGSCVEPQGVVLEPRAVSVDLGAPIFGHRGSVLDYPTSILVLHLGFCGSQKAPHIDASWGPSSFEPMKTITFLHTTETTLK